MIGLTKAVAVDVVAQGIRVNAICPATVDSPSLRGRIQNAADPVAARAAFEARQPMGRIGTPEEIANLALYLASDESSYTTGGVHVIDGGWTAIYKGLIFFKGGWPILARGFCARVGFHKRRR